MTAPFFLILGLGRSGLSTARWMQSQKMSFFAWDDVASQRHLAEAEKFPLQDPKGEDFPWEKITHIVISPGIPHVYPEPHPVISRAQEFARKHQKDIEIISDLELFIRTFRDCRYIAVTGTNGKSTTTALLGHLLHTAHVPSAIGANFGIPVFEMPLLPKEGIYVFEVSSYQLETTPSLAPLISILLNITPDHLERHGGFEGYVGAKEKVFPSHPHSQPSAVIGIDSPETFKIYENLKNKGYKDIWTVGILREKGRVFKKGSDLWEAREGRENFLCSLKDFKALKGDHNAQNVAAAIATLKILNVPETIIMEGLKTFPGLAHRQEFTRTYHGITFINDSKGTNVDATEKALKVYEDIYWILGGKPKADDISDLKPYFSKVQHVFLIGQSQELFAKALEGYIPYTRSETLKQAVLEAFSKAQKDFEKNPSLNPHILLSPACASFDQFKSFEERGEKFKEYVNALS